VAAFTVIVGTLATARLISDFLTASEDENVARDMGLAETFYQQKLQEISAASAELAGNPWLVTHLPTALESDSQALKEVGVSIDLTLENMRCDCMNILLVMDTDGKIVTGKSRSNEAAEFSTVATGNWGNLSIVASTLENGYAHAGTEIIPVEYLYQVDLAEQAHIVIRPTDRAAPQLFNPREGRAGLALVGVHPIIDDAGSLLGAAISVYMFNNDFTLVDQIKDVAGIDSVTVFFGDLRVSTNVLNEDGTRAVGTRVSQDVFDTVLVQGSEYQGRAFVVNEWYTTRYEPLRDHLGKVVGSLYVGTRVSAFEALMSTFNRQVALIALVSIVLAGIIAIPITRVITRPVEDLVDANRRLAQGNMTVRVDDFGPGELGELGRSFNTMVETLNRIQQELLHKEKLASVGQLSAGVAHEINNPLASILLFSEMMYKDCEADDPRRSDLEMIITETKRCKLIVADLLNFARQQEVMAQDTHLPELLNQTIDLVSHLPSYKGVKIECRYSPDVSIIQGDPEQLQQVFTNLLNNAAEAMPKGGSITVDLRKVNRDSVEVRITDTGTGIPPENMSQLFTPFFTTKGPGKGTGLGLSISYGIIKMHRGQIRVQSQEGIGTTFTVTLPTQLPNQRLAMNDNLIG